VTDNDLWLLLPALGRVRRITSSRLDGAFAGTDFSYADLMPMQIDRYNHVLLRDKVIGGAPYAVVESRPKTREYATSIGYGAIRTWIRRTNGLPGRVEYDDRQGRHLKTQSIGDPRPTAGGKFIMGERRMRREDNSSETLIRLRNVRFDSALSAADFTPQRLEVL
jgi:uncharacterized protein